MNNKTEDYKTLYDIIKNDNITGSTANMYVLNLLKIAKDMKLNISDKTAFTKPELLESLKNNQELKLNTIKNKLVSILVYLKSIKSDEDIINKYKDTVDMFSARIDRQNKKLEKTEKESSNWYTKEELLQKVKILKSKLKKNIIQDYDYLKDYMKYILLLIHISYPMRNDLSDALIMTASQFKKKKINDNDNYIILSSDIGYILLFNFKTVKSKGNQKIVIDKDILKEIKKYRKVLTKYKKEQKIDNDYFIIHKKGNKFNRNEYTKLFNEIFEDDNKKVSTTMIRKIICSDVWKMKDIKDLSNRMQHSVEQAMKSYVKIC